MPPFGFFASTRANGPRLFACLVMSASLVSPCTSMGSDVNCVDRLPIQGSAAGELRSRLRLGRLAQSDSPACDSAAIRLQRLPGGYLLSLRLGREKTERRVRSINDASTWTESWLEPIVNERASVTPANRSGENVGTPTGGAQPEPTQATPTSYLTFGVGPEFTLGSNEAVFLGPAIFGQYRVVPPIWFGLNVGYGWQLADARERRLLRASVLAGPAWDLAPRLSFTPGIGIGIYSGRMLDPTSTTGQSMHMGGGYFELTTRATYELGNRWSVSGALGGRWYAITSKGKLVTVQTEDDSDEATSSPGTVSMPSEVPLLEFTTTFDVCYRFGGAP